MILLDTHALLWLGFMPEKLSAKATALIDHARLEGSGLNIAAISLWGIAHLESKGRFALTQPVDHVLANVERNFTILPLSAAIALAAAELPPRYPSDPMDRLIGATALVHGPTLLTRDISIRASRAVPTAW